MDPHPELHTDGTAVRLNWLRAAVLGANDGIVSLAALVVGVAGAAVSAQVVFLTGVAGLLAGAFSMAVGEYVSVSSQRDTERALLEKERYELHNYADSELKELTELYEKKGLKPETAHAVAVELTAHDAFAAHVDAELGFDPNNLINPIHAAFASAAAFTAGALIPLVAIVLPPESMRVPVTFLAVLVALILTGILSARVSGARVRPVTVRMVVGGILAMAVTFGIGTLFNPPHAEAATRSYSSYFRNSREGYVSPDTVERATSRRGVSSATQKAIDKLDKEPVDELPIPVLFGVRLADISPNFGDPRDDGARTHEGEDILAPKDDPIVSPTDAVVVSKGTGESSGNFIYTANPGKETFAYMHLDKFAEDIKVGTVLKEGDLIGYVGDTGNAKGGPTTCTSRYAKAGPQRTRSLGSNASSRSKSAWMP